MKILVVEDNEIRMDFFRTVLLEDTLTFATTSVEAVCLLEKNQYDLILLDMDLDDGLGQGLVVARWLKDAKNTYVDVIVHSMNISAADEARRLLPGTHVVPIAEMKRMVSRFGREGLIERILDA